MTLLRTLLEVPLVWFAAAFAASWLLQRRAAGVRWFAAAEGAASVAILLVVAALNVRTAGFLVSFGANVLSIAAAHAHGQLMYHAVGGPQLYSLVYGPYTFLVYEPMLHHRDALDGREVGAAGARRVGDGGDVSAAAPRRAGAVADGAGADGRGCGFSSRGAGRRAGRSRRCVGGMRAGACAARGGYGPVVARGGLRRVLAAASAWA